MACVNVYCACVYANECVCAHVYVWMYVCVCVCVCVYVHVRVCVCIIGLTCVNFFARTQLILWLIMSRSPLSRLQGHGCVFAHFTQIS
jgi:hypothetical protein